MSELTKALIQFHKDVDKIDKNARGNYGKFADLANVLSTVTPALLRNGLVITQEFLEDSLVTTLRHVSGEAISSSCRLIVAEGRNKTQEWGKAVTYQRRYAIVSILSIVADLDMDGESQEAYKPAPPKQEKKPTPAPKPTPTPAPTPERKRLSDIPLDDKEYDLVITTLKTVHANNSSKLQRVTDAFRKQFKTPANQPLSQSITNQAHVAFIHDFLEL